MRGPHRLLFVPVALVVLALSACALEPNPVAVAGQDLFRDFNPQGDPDAAFTELHRLVTMMPEVAASSAATLVHDPDEQVRYAAIYVLGLTATDGEPVDALVEALEDDRPYLRAIAGGALVGIGRKEAIPVLIELLTEEGSLPASQPKTTSQDLAYEGLSTYTGETFGWPASTTDDAREASQGRWRDWWEEQGSSLRWDPDAQRYVA